MLNLKSVIFFALALVFLLTGANAQVDRSGFTFGFGAGFGYSNHAASYVVEEKIGIIEEYSGFRAFSTNLKVGWGFTPRTQVYYTLNFTPGNATISPYQSFYQGGLVTYSFEAIDNLIIGAGAGVNKAHDMNKGDIAKGTLVNLSLAYEVGPHFTIELNSIFGKMDNNPPPLSFIGTSEEFSLFLTINSLFYKKAKE